MPAVFVLDSFLSVETQLRGQVFWYWTPLLNSKVIYIWIFYWIGQQYLLWTDLLRRTQWPGVWTYPGQYQRTTTLPSPHMSSPTRSTKVAHTSISKIVCIHEWKWNIEYRDTVHIYHQELYIWIENFVRCTGRKVIFKEGYNPLPGNKYSKTIYYFKGSFLIWSIHIYLQLRWQFERARLFYTLAFFWWERHRVIQRCCTNCLSGKPDLFSQEPGRLFGPIFPEVVGKQGYKKRHQLSIPPTLIQEPRGWCRCKIWSDKPCTVGLD